MALDGPDCFYHEDTQLLFRKFEERLHWVMVVYAAILFALGIFANSLLKLLTIKVSQASHSPKKKKAYYI